MIGSKSMGASPDDAIYSVPAQKPSRWPLAETVIPKKLPLRRLIPRDSGYDSPGRSSTCPRTPVRHEMTRGPTAARDHEADKRVERMIKQPESTPISPEQLATEVKGIYAGLVMVEAKCINIDAAQAADPKAQLTKDQWQALIALHRTLLYEHHDFLMATQHPTATPALRGLALKYNMPARMWKHGIHAFLEVLRHRHLESQDYMLAFIYLAYQMMALLFETVPSFTDTWIECLGDLARYRMAVEEDRLTTNSLHANISTYAFPERRARDSLAHLCEPIVQAEHSIQSETSSLESKLVAFFALISSSSLDRDAADPFKRDPQFPLIITNPDRPRLDPNHLPWAHLALLLQQLCEKSQDSACGPFDALRKTSPGSFTKKCYNQPLAEDYQVRGSIWEQAYIPSELFDSQLADDGLRGWCVNNSMASSQTLPELRDAEVSLTIHATNSARANALAAIRPQARGAFPISTQLSDAPHTRVGTITRRLMAIIYAWIQCIAIAEVQCARAAPTRIPASDAELPTEGHTFFKFSPSQVAIGLLGVITLANCIQIAWRQPTRTPRLSGDVAIGLSLLAWILIELNASATDLSNVIITLWFAVESDYVVRMCCVVSYGRLYFWASVALGLFFAMFIAALQSDGRPTIANILVASLPSAAFYVSCAARILKGKATAVRRPQEGGGTRHF